jgi:hypothetical protein
MKWLVVVQAQSRLRTPLLPVEVGPVLALMCVVGFRRRWREPQPSQEEVAVHNHTRLLLPLLHKSQRGIGSGGVIIVADAVCPGIWGQFACDTVSTN